ncbi:MAG: F0F1 ATP synthase subunit B [Pirellulales bacterium]|nr:F0F1 ATP synthase subunit B [Pirellulales bacterium]
MTVSKMLAGACCALALALAPAAVHGQDDAHPAAAPAEAGHDDAAHDEHGEGHGAHDPMATDPLTVDPDLALWTFGVFAILLLVLWKFAWGPISQGLDKREQRIADDIASAERSNQQAKQLLAEYEHKLAAAQDEIRALLDEARRDAEHTQQDMLAKAAAEAEGLKQRARREIDTATDQALKQLAEHSAKLAVELAGKILHTELSPDRHARLVEEAVAMLPSGGPSVN